MGEFLTEDGAREIVDKYMTLERVFNSTQEILDSGPVSRLRGYKVKPGKVSDSVFGGNGSYKIKNAAGKTEVVEFENPPLNTRDGIPLRIMVRTARISTHDITRGDIPFKDQILAANHNFMRRLLAPYIGTSQFDVPGLDDNAVVIAAEDLKTIMFENVIRAYMAKSSTSTSLYQHYIKGTRIFCGHLLPEGLFANGQLPYIMDTPSTKSDEHDESVSADALIERGICTTAQYMQISRASLVSFGVVSEFLRKKGLIAVDTKTEHGINRKGEIVGQDEIWTMDSSRFWIAKDYNEQLEKFLRGEIPEVNPRSYSKEFARGMSQGDEGYTGEQRALIAVRYIMGIQQLLGTRFEPDLRSRDERVISGLEAAVKLVA